MTTTTLPRPATDPVDDLGVDPTDGYDFYREIHKGIRFALFHTVLQAGRLDVSDTNQVAQLVAAHRRLLELLHLHHHHEDTFVQPLVDACAPALATLVDQQHGDVEEAMAHLERLAERLATATASDRPQAAHRLYLTLTELTSMYLNHQLVEEMVVMPALRAAVPTEELLALDMALRSSIAPPVMATTMAVMLPAMNVDERVDMLGGMSMAPPDVFAIFRGAAEAALTPTEWSQVAGRLGLV